jgi:hypothetical protein
LVGAALFPTAVKAQPLNPAKPTIYTTVAPCHRRATRLVLGVSATAATAEIIIMNHDCDALIEEKP